MEKALEALKKRHLELLKSYGLTEIEKRFSHERESHFEATKRTWKDDIDELTQAIDRARNMVPNYGEISFFQELYESLPWSPLQKPIYCGHFLAPTVNAGIREYDEGYLALVNTHLLIAMDNAALSVILSAPSWTVPGERMDAALTREEAAKHLRGVIDALLGDKPAFTLLQPRLRSELQWASLLINSTMGFIITHEYCHALLGHKIENVENEREADMKAVELYVSHAINKLRANALEMGAWLSGPPLVLLVGLILEQRGDWGDETHPPCLERLLAAKKDIETKLKNTEGYRTGWNFVSHFVHIATIAGLLDLGKLYTVEADWQ